MIICYIMARQKGIRRREPHIPENRKHSKGEWLLLAAILVITLIVFSPAISHDFVNWDDDINITQNQNVKVLNTESVKNMFSTAIIGGYTPLTTLSFAVEHHFFGLDPRVYHINNILLHLLCTALVFLFVRKLGLGLAVTLTVTLLFGIHPMRVESVAWATERKDMLFAFFYFLSALLYMQYRVSGKIWLYLISIAVFILSLLSKIQAVSMPLTLLLVDYLFDKRFHLAHLVNKIPFFILSLITGVAGILLLQDAGSLETGTILPFWQRLFVGSYSFLVYIVKSLIPYEMSAIYPFPAKLDIWHYLSLPVAVLLGWMVWKYRKSRVELVFGLLFFFVNIVFMLQVVGAGQGYLADRFTYVGYMGLFVVYGWTAGRLIPMKWQTPVLLAGLVWITALGISAHSRVKVWKNTETLFTDVLTKYPKVAVAHNNMGRYLREKNQYEKAIASYNKAIEINPESSNTYSNRGKAFFDLGRVDEAISDFNRAIELNENYVEALSNRGAALASKGNLDAALADLNKAMDLDPRNANVLSNRSLAYYSAREYEKAAGDITDYLALKPDDADMLNLRSLAFNHLNRNNEALDDLNRAIQLNPSQGIFWQNRSFLLNKMGDRENALRDIRQAEALGVKTDPGYLQMLQR